jgi:hypothetical protein
MSEVNYKEEQEKSILNDAVASAFIKQFNLKRLVVGRGHDCGGLIADLCLKTKVLVEFNDDGWGGEPELNFDKKNMVILVEMLKNVDYAQRMFDNGWAFMKTPDRISIESQITSLVEELAKLKDREKLLKKCKSALIYGNEFSNSVISWKGIKDLSELDKNNLQRTYDKYKALLKSNQKFVNTDEQLLKLGIKL